MATRQCQLARAGGHLRRARRSCGLPCDGNRVAGDRVLVDEFRVFTASARPTRGLAGPFSRRSASGDHYVAVSQTSFDFGYPWWLNYGHLALFGVLLTIALVARAAGASRQVMIVLGVLSVWAGSVAVLVSFFGINRVPPLPTDAFLRAGMGSVLDLGAGTGRSSIMVLRARPRATLVASDLFGTSFNQHFGPGERPQDRLSANLKAAGVDGRATIETADMLKLPFPDRAFDAIVSAYAMDHLGRNGARTALAEANRVLKLGGDFLLILVANDRWAQLAFGPMLSHGGTYGAGWWRDAAGAAGFEIREQGSRPVTTYFLLTKR